MFLNDMFIKYIITGFVIALIETVIVTAITGESLKQLMCNSHSKYDFLSFCVAYLIILSPIAWAIILPVALFVLSVVGVSKLGWWIGMNLHNAKNKKAEEKENEN